MGLFDMFKGDTGEDLSPHLAFVVALMYMMAADGEIGHEEVGHLLAVLGGEKQKGGTIGVGAQNKALLDAAMRYYKSHNVDDFIAEASPGLTDAQKMCILTNLVDSLLSDGVADPNEQRLFERFLQGFGVSEERFRPFFEVIALKNDRSVFTNQDHPQNQSGYEVRLSV